MILDLQKYLSLSGAIGLSSRWPGSGESDLAWLYLRVQVEGSLESHGEQISLRISKPVTETIEYYGPVVWRFPASSYSDGYVMLGLTAAWVEFDSYPTEANQVLVYRVWSLAKSVALTLIC